MRGARPERKLEEAIERDGIIRKGDCVLVACSGGADSAGLAAVLSSVAVPLDLRLTIAHVNHGVRASGWQDEAVALRIGAALNVPVKVVALEMKRNDEAALREARYEALAALAGKAAARVVATAHTAEDQTETVLLALFRGTGPAGLAGMPARRELLPGLDLARPLLRTERSEVRAYVQACGLPYAVDPTNSDLELRRNAVRKALEALRPLFPSLDAAVSRAAELVAAELGDAPEAALRRQVRETLREQKVLRNVDFEHVEAAVRALSRGRSGRFSMGGGVELAIENGQVTVHRKQR